MLLTLTGLYLAQAIVWRASYNRLHGRMSAAGHKHRIPVLLSQPLCRNCLQYLPNFVHRSEATQVPAADITALRHKRAYRALRERKSTRDKCSALVGGAAKRLLGGHHERSPTEGNFCVLPPALPR